jgi:integrase/recombinase XerC/integrase/recombinase XerD
MIDYFEFEFSVPASEIDVNDIMIDNINNYVLYLRGKIKNYGHPYTKAGGVLSKRSIRTYSIDMRTFFNWLSNYEITTHNEMKKFRMIKSESKSIIPIKKSQMYIIDDCFDIKTCMGMRNLAMLHLMIDMGFRSGDVCNLKLGDIDFADDFIALENGKGDKDRIVPMARVVKKYINRYLTFVERNPEDFLFTDSNGNQVTANSIKGVFTRLKTKSGIKVLYPHLLRHTFATSFVLGGGNLEVLRYYMGHSDISTTQKYLHIATGLQFHRNVYKLDPIFFIRNEDL